MTFSFRYTLLQVKCDKRLKLTSAELADTLKKAVLKNYGDFGLASIGNLSVKLMNDKHKLAIIRVSHGPHRFLTSIIPLLNKVGKELATCRILYIGATIRQCKKYLIDHQNEVIRKIITAFNNDTERQEFLTELSKSMEI